MSKMGDEYLKQMERQFGDVSVGNDVLCNYCGERYGYHSGLKCPEPISSKDMVDIETEYQIKAVELAKKEFDKDFYGLPDEVQQAVYGKAMNIVNDKLIALRRQKKMKAIETVMSDMEVTKAIGE